MATTYTYGGTLEISASAQASAGTDWSGTVAAALASSIEFAVSGGTPPTISGFLRGTGTATNGDILIANSTDPLQGMGDSTFSPGFTVAGSKLKFLMVVNNDTTQTITFSNGAANGTTIFDGTNTHGEKIEPGGLWLYYDPTGALSAALTTGSNDKITVAISGGTPEFDLLAFYGP